VYIGYVKNQVLISILAPKGVVTHFPDMMTNNSFIDRVKFIKKTTTTTHFLGD
jgi:hypothetical protein